MESRALQLSGATVEEDSTIVETAQVDADGAGIDADDSRHS